MSESLYAFLALGLVLIFTLNQSRDTVELQRELAAIEVEVLANAVASEKMQLIASKDFDANANPQTPEDLTPTSEFGSGNFCEGEATNCKDLDDFNDMQSIREQYDLELSDEETVQFYFNVTAKVEYVDESGQPSIQQTWTKAVTLYVEQHVEEGEHKYLRNPIRIRRQFTSS